MSYYLFCYKLSKTDETFVNNKVSRVISNNYLFKKKNVCNLHNLKF